MAAAESATDLGHFGNTWSPAHGPNTTARVRPFRRSFNGISRIWLMVMQPYIGVKSGRSDRTESAMCAFLMANRISPVCSWQKAAAAFSPR